MLNYILEVPQGPEREINIDINSFYNFKTKDFFVKYVDQTRVFVQNVIEKVLFKWSQSRKR